MRWQRMGPLDAAQAPPAGFLTSSATVSPELTAPKPLKVNTPEKLPAAGAVTAPLTVTDIAPAWPEPSTAALPSISRGVTPSVQRTTQFLPLAEIGRAHV